METGQTLGGRHKGGELEINDSTRHREVLKRSLKADKLCTDSSHSNVILSDLQLEDLGSVDIQITSGTAWFLLVSQEPIQAGVVVGRNEGFRSPLCQRLSCAA